LHIQLTRTQINILTTSKLIPYTFKLTKHKVTKIRLIPEYPVQLGRILLEAVTEQGLGQVIHLDLENDQILISAKYEIFRLRPVAADFAILFGSTANGVTATVGTSSIDLPAAPSHSELFYVKSKIGQYVAVVILGFINTTPKIYEISDHKITSLSAEFRDFRPPCAAVTVTAEGAEFSDGVGKLYLAKFSLPCVTPPVTVDVSRIIK
jgi:hypothetical protein